MIVPTFLHVRRARRFLADERLAQTLVRSRFNDAVLFVEVLADLCELRLLDVIRALVLFDAVAREYLYVDDRTFDAGTDAQRRVFYVGGFFTEDRTQQFFFRRQLCLAFRSDFADQNVARLHFRTDVHDTGFVQLRSAASPTFGMSQ